MDYIRIFCALLTHLPPCSAASHGRDTVLYDPSPLLFCPHPPGSNFSPFEKHPHSLSFCLVLCCLGVQGKWGSYATAVMCHMRGPVICPPVKTHHRHPRGVGGVQSIAKSLFAPQTKQTR